MHVIRMAVICLLAAAWAVPSAAAPILYDGFDPGIQSPPWKVYDTQGHILEGSSYAHSAPNAMVSIRNWRYPYGAYRELPQAYLQDVYYSVWVCDDATMPPGLPGPADDPLWTEEHVPNSFIRLESSDGLEFLRIGSIGKNKTATAQQPPQNVFFSVQSAQEGVKVLFGPPASEVPVRREPGWRKWMIRLKPYTGTKGDVEYYVDGQRVYSGFRFLGPFGAVPVDIVGLGPNTWSAEYYWYDDVEFGDWPVPVDATGAADALTHPDGTWVRLTNVVVSEVRLDAITVEDAGSNGIDVHPARFQAPGDVVTVTGRLTTVNGNRYLDSLTIATSVKSPVYNTATLAEARALPDGTRVRLPERVVTALHGPVRFLQEGNMQCGLKVRNIYEPLVGNKAIVTGQIMTVGLEKLLEAETVTVTSSGNPMPEPVAVPNRTLYLPATAPEGMLVVTTGEVVHRPDMWYPGWCEIRDFSQPKFAPPVRVQVPHHSYCPSVGQYVWVRGAYGWLHEASGSRPQIYCRYPQDIRVLK